jgi:Serine carboxypeptidase
MLAFYPLISISDVVHHTLASHPVGRPGQSVSHRQVTSPPDRFRAELGARSGSFPQIQVEPVYFNRPDVKSAIHAPQNVQWTECPSSNVSVFVAPGDTSPPSAWEVLPKVMACGARVVMATGLADFVLVSEG